MSRSEQRHHRELLRDGHHWAEYRLDCSTQVGAMTMTLNSSGVRSDVFSSASKLRARF